MGASVRISANGRICIPADVRQRLGLRDGDMLSLTVTDDALVLRTPAQNVRAVQEEVRKLMEGKPAYTMEDFLRDRRSMWDPNPESSELPADDE